MGPLLERMHGAKATCDELKAFYSGRSSIAISIRVAVFGPSDILQHEHRSKTITRGNWYRYVESRWGRRSRGA